MCFETTKSARAKIAKKDIVCWKVIRDDGSSLYQFNSKLKYKVGRKNRMVSIMPRHSFGGKSIAAGYHSYKVKEYAYTNGFCCFVASDIQLVFKFIIPTGTRYFENDNEYVSETIILQ